MTTLVSPEDVYKILTKYNTSLNEMKCQTLPGSSCYGSCPDKHLLVFDELGSYINTINTINPLNPLNPKFTKGYCYQIRSLPSGKTIENLKDTELQYYYRLVCFNCSHEHYINQLKTHDKDEYDKIIYMNIDREKENMCMGITSRLHLCKNSAIAGSHLCNVHKDQKIDGFTNFNTSNFTW